MYKSGLLKCLDPVCKLMDSDGYCDEWEEGHKHSIADSRTEGSHHYQTFVAPEICYYLPHSCDEWVIGGEKEIKALINDLKSALLTIRSTEQQKTAAG